VFGLLGYLSNKTVEKETGMIRKAAFAYEWYPGDPKDLRLTVQSYLGDCTSPEKALGVVSPHAGYIYSGHVAGAVYGSIHVPDVVIVLSVNHRGIGAPAAIMRSGVWETPMGSVSIHEELAQILMGNASLLREDGTAHIREHSLELQLPFIQCRNPGFQLVPIALQQLRYEECEELGKSIATSIKTFGQEILLVASNDMTHFEPQKMAEKKDKMAIDKIVKIDPEGLYTTVKSHRISMCGVIPSTVMLCACKHLGAQKGRLIKYATSGDVSRDYANVVGYAGILIQ
jgi:hypothetical protein